MNECDVEVLAEVAHDAYEKRATVVGWGTNETSRRPWSDVPFANQECTRAAVRAVLAHCQSGLRREDVDALRLEARRRRNRAYTTVWGTLADRIDAILSREGK